MEGRALEGGAGRRWAWAVPWFSGSLAELIAALSGAEQLPFVLVGLAAGVAWQLLYRRDLTSRLTFTAVVVTVALVLSFVLGQAIVWVGEEQRTVLYATGVLLGLIYTEHYLRRQDARADQEATAETGVAAES